MKIHRRKEITKKEKERGKRERKRRRKEKEKRRERERKKNERKGKKERKKEKEGKEGRKKESWKRKKKKHPWGRSRTVHTLGHSSGRRPVGSRDCKNSSQQSGDDGPMALPQILIWSNDVNILLLFIHYTNLFRGLDGRGVRVVMVVKMLFKLSRWFYSSR